MPDDSPQPDCRTEILAAVNDEAAFLRLTLTSPPTGGQWEHVALRPIELRGRRHLQATYSAGKKHIVKNFAPEEFQAAIDSLLAMGFSRLHVQATSGDLHIRITRKGKVLLTRGKPSRQEDQPRLEHDHVKSYPLPVDKPDAFLHAIGIMTAEGKVKADMFAKFRQINEFLRVIDQTAGQFDTGESIFLIDCGCGSAQLTFAAMHYLRHVRGRNVQAIGIDVNSALIEKCRGLRDQLGWPGLDFEVSPIADYTPPRSPQVVVSLHACDTATDEALVRGVHWASRVILSAPCCQHELHNLLQHADFRAVLRHGLLKERLADVLTDALRAAALRMMGYRTKVFEFISPEHTSKNLMISAERIAGADPGRDAAAAEYLALRNFWGVTPFIERALGEPFQKALTAAGKNP